MRKIITLSLYIISLFILATIFSGCNSGVTDSGNVLSENVGFENATEAEAFFDVESVTLVIQQQEEPLPLSI